MDDITKPHHKYSGTDEYCNMVIAGIFWAERKLGPYKWFFLFAYPPVFLSYGDVLRFHHSIPL